MLYMKKFLAATIILALSCALLFLPTSGAVSDSSLLQSSPDQRSKEEFAAVYESGFRPGYADSETDTERLKELAAYIADGFYRDILIRDEGFGSAAEEKLAALGFYIYRTPSRGYEENPSQKAGDEFFLGNAAVLYDTYTNRWIVAGGGFHTGEQWKKEAGSIWFGFPRTGTTRDLGGYDAIGVVLLGTSGGRPRMANSLSCFGNGRGAWFYNPNPMANDFEGACFAYQDALRVERWSNPFWLDVSYTGSRFSVIAVYDAQFEDFFGAARICYAHTWAEAAIAGVNPDATQYFMFTEPLHARQSYSSDETDF